VAALLDNEELCRVSAIYNGYRAKNFGGRFIFYCPRGFVFFTSPLIRGGRHEMSIIGGPLLMSEYEDYIEFDIAKKVSGFDREALTEALSCIPVMNGRMVTALSEQLFVNALHLSDSNYLTAVDPNSADRLQDYLQAYNGLSSFSDDFQAKQEQKLIMVLSQHEEYPARALLNSIIGHILFHSGKNLELVRNKMLEFTILLSQLALKEEGVNPDYIFGRDCACLSEIDNLETMDDIVFWLNGLLSRFSECVFSNNGFSEVIDQAILYMKANHRRNVSLEETARFVYVSTSYLSKIFKKETGYTIKNYLNKLRIEESKKLMMDKSLSLVTISNTVGFEDQSYFSKVFRKCEGISPRQYRKRFGSICDPVRLQRRRRKPAVGAGSAAD
jgi:AraC-like DNA-binding protein